MERGTALPLRAYMEVLRLVRRLPPETRAYYSKYARENFVNYRELDDPSSLPDLLHRAYTHSSWVLSKVGSLLLFLYLISSHILLFEGFIYFCHVLLQYSVNVSAADRLKNICSCNSA